MATGPSTSISPYLLASEPNVRFTSILTVGDAIPGDGVFGGIPDGLGAFDNGDGTITVLVNHELRARKQTTRSANQGSHRCGAERDFHAQPHGHRMRSARVSASTLSPPH